MDKQQRFELLLQCFRRLRPSRRMT
jgi:hypothetical protein